ncbi:MAG: hypothetical protein K2J14_01160 [Treponemataceae bacterium]|nr:hypothetical protein [Treponemataceae bacterium]
MTKQEKIDFLRELKAEINENTTFSCTYPHDEDIEYFIWVKTKDAKIGNLACHYEVLFYAKGEGMRTDVPFVEVHFESPTYKSFPKDLRMRTGLTEKKEGSYTRTMARNSLRKRS